MRCLKCINLKLFCILENSKIQEVNFQKKKKKSNYCWFLNESDLAHFFLACGAVRCWGVSSNVSECISSVKCRFLLTLCHSHVQKFGVGKGEAKHWGSLNTSVGGSFYGQEAGRQEKRLISRLEGRGDGPARKMLAMQI